MNFDKFDEILKGLDDFGLSDSQKNSAEYALAQTVKFGQEYKDTIYTVPFPFVNFQLMAETVMSLHHPAFTKEGVEKFFSEDFPELEYGGDENQPTLATVFAEYLNVMMSTVVHEKIEFLQSEKLVEVTFEGDKLQYTLVDDSLSEQYGSIIEYANVFL